MVTLGRYVDDVANLTPLNGQPFVGRSAFAHKGGMHAHAMALAPTSYEHIDPNLVGNIRRVLVSELSGRSNIAMLTEQYGINDPEVTKQVLAEIVRREHIGCAPLHTTLAHLPCPLTSVGAVWQVHVRGGRGLVQSCGAEGDAHVHAAL